MYSSAHPLDLAIFVVFLIITLVIGLSYGRQVKTIQDYALGGRNFSTPILSATIVATWTSGWVLALILEKVYTEGLYFIIAITGDALALLFIGHFLANRAGEFLSSVSVAETMGKLYGKKVRIITAIAGITKAIGIVAVQFKVSAKVLSLLFDLQGTHAAFVAAVIVILYSTFGGIRAVTFTDAFQFITFGIFIPVLTLVVWNSLKDSINLIELFTTDPLFSFRALMSSPAKWGACLSLLLFFAASGIEPALFQRISMARTVKQAKKAFTDAFILYMGIILFMVWLAILIRASKPSVEPSLLLNYVINRYAYIGLKGCVTAGIMAMVMSTADSYINTASILFTHDIVGVLRINVKRPIVIARIFAFSVGMLGLGLALVMDDLLGIALLVASLYIPMITAPLLLAFFGFRTSKRVVLMAMAVGFVSMVIGRIYFKSIDSVIPGMLANLLTLLGSHYLLGEPGGWQKAAPDSPLALERAARKEAWQRRIQAVKSFKLYPYLQQNLPPQEGLYSLFGFYTIAATYTGFYTIGDSAIQSHREIYEGIYHTVLFATTAFLTFPIWPPTVKSYRFITFFWPLGMGAILFFAGTLLAILSQFHTMQVMVLTINLLIAVLLLQWSLALILAFSGVSLAIWFFKHYTGEVILLSNGTSLQFSLLYGLLLFTSLLIVLFKGKQAYAQLDRKNLALTRLDQENKANLLQSASEKQAALSALQHTGVEELLTITRKLQKMHVAEEEKEEMEALQTKLIPIAFHLQAIDTRAQDYLRLHISDLPIKPWCKQIKEAVRQKGIDTPIHCKEDTNHQHIKCDTARLTSLLVNSIVALQAASPQDPEEPLSILLSLEDTQLSYPLPDVEKGYIKYVPAIRIAITTGKNLPPIAPSYSPNLNGPSRTASQTPQALEQLVNGRIIKSHYGYAEVSPTTLVYVVPVDLEDVRPQDMDKAYMELDYVPKKANEHYKDTAKGIDAQAQEAAFLAEVAARSQADLRLVKMALETIKWYHGPSERKSGEPFYLHPLAVAQIVLDYNTDEATIIGALLHDTVEDTPMLLQHIEAMFGKEAAEVVDLVTHLQSIPGSIYKIKLSAIENLQMLERTGNKRGLYVKLADRMHNMRTINGHNNLAKRKLIAQETVDFFIPLAQRLGLKEAAAEFKERCLVVLATKE